MPTPLYSTGFEIGSLAAYSQTPQGWTLPSGGNGTAINTVAANQHRTALGVGGNNCVLVDDAFGTLTGAVLGGVAGARWFHVWGKPNVPTGSSLWVGVGEAGAAQFGIYYLANGNIQFYRGVTLVRTTVGGWNSAVAHWFAIEFDCREAGQVAVWIDGVLVDTFVGDCRATTTDGWDMFGFATWISGTGFSNNNFFIDDVVITDSVTGRLAEYVCPPLIPNGDTATAALTPSTPGPQFAMVDEVPSNDADYDAATAAGQESRFTFTNLPAGITAVGWAVFWGRATRDGAIVQGQVSVNSGGTVVYSAAETLPAAPSFFDSYVIRGTDPNTGLDWTVAGINAVEAGYRFL